MSGAGIDLLRRVALGCVSAEDAAVLSDCVRRYLAQAPAGVSLDDAFGLSVQAGGEPWYARERRERRDGELRALAARFCPTSMSVRGQALWLQMLVRRYESAGWLRDRASGQMPEHYRGTEKEFLFRAFLYGSVPSGERQLRTILGGETGQAIGNKSVDLLAMEE